MVPQGRGGLTQLPWQPALCPAGFNNIILGHREIPSTNPWHTTLSTACPAQRTPRIFQEWMSSAHAKHISDIRVYQAAAPLALVLSQKSRKRRKPASLRPNSPGQPQIPLLGWEVTGGSLHSPRDPRQTLLMSPSTQIEKHHPTFFLFLTHPGASPSDSAANTWHRATQASPPCVPLHPQATARNQVPKTTPRLSHIHPHFPPRQAPALARLSRSCCLAPPATGSCAAPTCFSGFSFTRPLQNRSAGSFPNSGVHPGWIKPLGGGY